MRDFEPITVELDGHTYKGHWQLRQGGRLCVGWRYGSKTVDLGSQRPEVVARRELPKLVKAWRQQQEREARRLERNAQRIVKTGRPLKQ